jgi:hypothetical protein
MLDLGADLAEPAIAGTLSGAVKLCRCEAFSFTAQSTPAASAARFLGPLA